MNNEKPQFRWLTDPDTTGGLADWADEMEAMQYPPCPANPMHVGALRAASNLSVVLTSKRFTDFIWTWGHECMIQDRVLEMFRNEGFTGFDVRPVKARMKVRAKKPDPCDDNPGVRGWMAALVKLPTLWELVITGWGGLINPESGMRIIERCPGCNQQVYSDMTDPSKQVDESQWDGSDFFMVWPSPRYIFVTDRVAEFIRKHKLTGARLIALADMEPEIATVAPLKGGALRWQFPDDRAHELGDPLGIY